LKFLVMLTIASSAVLSAQEANGFKLGAVSGYAGAGAMYVSGIEGLHPGLASGLEVGVHKYLGIFGSLDWIQQNRHASSCYRGCVSVSRKDNLYTLGAGLQVMASNRSRLVPYARVGMGYLHGTESVSIGGGIVSGYASDTSGAPALMAGGGLRTYLGRNFGLDVRVMGVRTIGYNGGGTAVTPSVGVFFQSR